MTENHNDQNQASKTAAPVFREAYFPTLLFYQDVDEAQGLNTQLIAAIREEKKRDMEGITRSNEPRLGGWHSRNELHQEPPFATLVEKIMSFGAEVSTSLGYHPNWLLAIDNMWSIINPPGSHNQSHIHPNSLWSGVYYIQAPKDCGRIKFTDPRTENLMQNVIYDPNAERSSDAWANVYFEPTPGRIIIFPSWLYHSVETNLSELTSDAGERIIVSFNLYQKRV